MTRDDLYWQMKQAYNPSSVLTPASVKSEALAAGLTELDIASVEGILQHEAEAQGGTLHTAAPPPQLEKTPAPAPTETAKEGDKGDIGFWDSYLQCAVCPNSGWPVGRDGILLEKSQIHVSIWEKMEERRQAHRARLETLPDDYDDGDCEGSEMYRFKSMLTAGVLRRDEIAQRLNWTPHQAAAAENEILAEHYSLERWRSSTPVIPREWKVEAVDYQTPLGWRGGNPM